MVGLRRSGHGLLYFLISLIFLGFNPGGLLLAGEAGAAEAEPLRFGVAPFMSPLALAKRMAPLREYLSSELGREVLIETSTDAAEFARRSLAGRYDILLTNPPFALDALDTGHYHLVVTQKRPMAGEIVVLESSLVTTIDQLAGRTIGTPPKVGLLGAIIESYLEELGLVGARAMQVRHFHSHHDSIAALRVGTIDASFIASFMRPHIEGKGVAIRVLAKSQDYPGLTLLTNRDRGNDFAAGIKANLLRLEDSERGRAVLEDISMPPFRVIERQELETVRPFIPALNGQGETP